MRSLWILAGLFPMLTACAGQEEASQLSTALARLLTEQSQQVNRYNNVVAVYIRDTNARASDNSSSASEVANQTRMLANTLDLDGKGTASANFKKHITKGSGDILADPLLAAPAAPAAATEAAAGDVSNAVKALTALAKGETTWDVAKMYFGVAEGAYNKVKEESEAPAQ